MDTMIMDTLVMFTRVIDTREIDTRDKDTIVMDKRDMVTKRLARIKYEDFPSQLASVEGITLNQARNAASFPVYQKVKDNTQGNVPKQNQFNRQQNRGQLYNNQGSHNQPRQQQGYQHGNYNPRQNNPSQGTLPQFFPQQGQCWNCLKFGHIARICNSKPSCPWHPNTNNHNWTTCRTYTDKREFIKGALKQRYAFPVFGTFQNESPFQDTDQMDGDIFQIPL